MHSVAEFPLLSNSNDDVEEADPGSDSDFEVEAKKEVGDPSEVAGNESECAEARHGQTMAWGPYAAC